MLLILWVLPLTCLEGGYIYSGTLKPNESLLLIESCQLSEVVQHMASRWQQRIAGSMMPSCDVCRLQFLCTLLFEVFLGRGWSAPAASRCVCRYPGFYLVFGV